MLLYVSFTIFKGLRPLWTLIPLASFSPLEISLLLYMKILTNGEKYHRFSDMFQTLDDIRPRGCKTFFMLN